MDLLLERDYDTLSAKAAEHLLKLSRKKTEPLICVAPGDSPAGLYKEDECFNRGEPSQCISLPR